MSNHFSHEFEVPPIPTDKRRIVFSFGVDDIEFFKCFPSTDYLGARYDKNPAQLMIVWDVFLRPYNCEMLIFNPFNQLLVSVPVPKSLNLPYTILDGMITEWVTKEEFVTIQFVFTKNGGEFTKSTLPVRLNLSEANRPETFKVIKPTDSDRIKSLVDRAIVTSVLRYDESSGWIYDFYADDGTLRFSLGWIPPSVVRCVDQSFSPNDKMVARANINVPFTFVLPLEIADGDSIVKSTTSYINRLEDATFEVWRDNGDNTFTLVEPLALTYGSDFVHAVLYAPINGYLRVSCKSIRFEPSEGANLLGSPFSGNLLMSEDNYNLVSDEEQDE